MKNREKQGAGSGVKTQEPAPAVYGDIIGKRGHFPVGMHPEGLLCADPDAAAAMALHAPEPEMPALEGGGKHQQDLPFGNVANRAHIQPAVESVRSRTETEAAALILVVHHGGEHEPADGNRTAPLPAFFLRFQNRPRLPGSEQHVQRDPQIGELSQPHPVEQILETGGHGLLAYASVKADPAADQKQPVRP